MDSNIASIANNISVVIPVFNKSKYIDRCVQSVLSQSISPGEIVIIDDGSTDDSLLILEKNYSNEIILKTQKNSGESVARNSGIELASKKYIAFLDGDDEWQDSFIMSICQLIHDYPACNLFSTGYKLVFNEEEKLPKYGNLDLGFRGIVSDYFESSLSGWSIFSSSSTVVSKQLFDNVGKFSPGLRLGADLDMWSRLAIQGKIAFLNEPHAIYHYFNDSSITNTEIPDSELLYTQNLSQALAAGKISVEIRTSVKRFIAKGLQYLVCEQAKYGRYNLLKKFLFDTRFYQYFGSSTLKMLLAIVVPGKVYTIIKNFHK